MAKKVLGNVIRDNDGMLERQAGKAVDIPNEFEKERNGNKEKEEER